MAAHIERMWAENDNITHDQTDAVKRDQVKVKYLAFECADEHAAINCLEANVPQTYDTLPLNSTRVTGRRGVDVWEVEADYQWPTDKADLSGSIYVVGTPKCRYNDTFSCNLDLVEPEAARTGGNIKWYINGALIGSGATIIPGLPQYRGKTLMAEYRHPAYNGRLTATCTIEDVEGGSGGNPEALSGTAVIHGDPGLGEVTVWFHNLPDAAHLEQLYYVWQVADGTIVHQGQGAAGRSWNASGLQYSYLSVQVSHNAYDGYLEAEKGESRDGTLSISSANNSHTIYFDNGEYTGGSYTSGTFGGDFTWGLNPDLEGSPQGVEVMSADANITYTVWAPSGEFSVDKFLKILQTVGKVNSDEFMGFPPRTLFLASASYDQQELPRYVKNAAQEAAVREKAVWYCINITLTYRPDYTSKIPVGVPEEGDTGKYFIEQRDVTAPGWAFVNCKAQKLPCKKKDKSGDWITEESVVITNMKLSKIYDEVVFNDVVPKSRLYRTAKKGNA